MCAEVCGCDDGLPSRPRRGLGSNARSFGALFGGSGGHDSRRARFADQRVEGGDVCVNHLAQALELRSGTG